MRKIGTKRMISRNPFSCNFQRLRIFTGPSLPKRVSRPTPLEGTKPLAGGSAIWCPGQDSNLHALRHTPLKRVCLPIPPPGQLGSEEGGLR